MIVNNVDFKFSQKQLLKCFMRQKIHSAHSLEVTYTTGSVRNTERNVTECSGYLLTHTYRHTHVVNVCEDVEFKL